MNTSLLEYADEYMARMMPVTGGSKSWCPYATMLRPMKMSLWRLSEEPVRVKAPSLTL